MGGASWQAETNEYGEPGYRGPDVRHNDGSVDSPFVGKHGSEYTDTTYPNGQVVRTDSDGNVTRIK